MDLSLLADLRYQVMNSFIAKEFVKDLIQVLIVYLHLEVLCLGRLQPSYIDDS